MASNLPPGVNVSDIPGNRPEDEAWEKLVEEFCDSLTKEEQEFLEKRVTWLPTTVSIVEKAIQFGMDRQRKEDELSTKESDHYCAEHLKKEATNLVEETLNKLSDDILVLITKAFREP